MSTLAGLQALESNAEQLAKVELARAELAEQMLVRGQGTYSEVLAVRYGGRLEKILREVRRYRADHPHITYWTGYSERELDRPVKLMLGHVSADHYNGLRLGDAETLAAGFDPEKLTVTLAHALERNAMQLGRAVFHELNHGAVDLEAGDAWYYDRQTREALRWAELSDDLYYRLDPAEMDCRIADLNAFWFYRYHSRPRTSVQVLMALNALGARIPTEALTGESVAQADAFPLPLPVATGREREVFADAADLARFLRYLRRADEDLYEEILREIILRAPGLA